MAITQAILAVAGYGTRFLPWTKVVPKELLPIGNVPIIGLLVDECMSIGITDICFVISRGKEAIPQYFYTQPELERELEMRGKKHMLSELTKYHAVNFHVAYQDQMLGDGHAISQAASWIRTDTVAVLYGDDLITGEKNGMQQLHSAWKEVGCPQESAFVALEDVDRSMVGRYGIVSIEPSDHASRIRKVTGMVEKPKPEEAPSTLGIVGKYIVPRSIIDTLSNTTSTHHDKEIRLIDALKSGLEENRLTIYGYECEGKRFDTGTPEGYTEAVRALT